MHNEEGLVARLSAGDLEAFDKLYWTYQDAVFRNAYKLLRDTELAEDVVQEVFISLWENRASLQEGRSVSGWLFVSSYNRSVNMLKKQQKEKTALRDIALARVPDDEYLELPDLQFHMLGKAIAQLSIQKRRVFELCKLQGYSYAEAADKLKISKHTVKEYLGLAVQFVRDFAKSQPEQAFLLAITTVNIF